ncbi:proline racemase family protein [Hamadaea tsunoensis]|uniref:proline racemase family protein n=1 Tax=Hamadaea tsunoensis TaxID=53368 RepID=UPI001FDEA6E4|nr:proline racemase family protein [Hamadaea tsunoensis]
MTTIDYHTGGEPFRIATSGVPEIRGATVRDRREYARNSRTVDAVRRFVCHEPRGHSDMYGCFPVPPDDDGAHLGVLFWHKDGFSTACGHGTIALGAWAVESGLVPAAPDGTTDVVIDVPSGRVTARVACRGGVIESVTFVSVASYVLGRDVPVRTARGTVLVDVAYGGAIYASVPAKAFGLTVSAEHHDALIAAGREVKNALADSEVARHPSDDRLSGIYGTILYDDLGDTDLGGVGGNPHQRNVTIFADGEVDRSPCGSGTAARVALLAADGRLGPVHGSHEAGSGRVLRHDSIVGSTFTARVAGTTEVEGRPAVLPEVEGMAYRTGEHRFTLDPRDPVGRGFLLR